MTTPEGKVKNKIRKMLKSYADADAPLYSYWPVPAGYGPSSLDLIICAAGQFVGVEAKAPGKKPTPRQGKCIADIDEAGGTTVVVDGDAGVRALENILAGIFAEAGWRNPQR